MFWFSLLYWRGNHFFNYLPSETTLITKKSVPNQCHGIARNNQILQRETTKCRENATECNGKKPGIKKPNSASDLYQILIKPKNEVVTPYICVCFSLFVNLSWALPGRPSSSTSAQEGATTLQVLTYLQSSSFLG